MKTPAWGNSSAGPEAGKDAAAARTWRGVGEWSEDWGELNAGKQPPAVFVLDLDGFTVQGVQGLPADSSAGQPVWAPSGKFLSTGTRTWTRSLAKSEPCFKCNTAYTRSSYSYASFKMQHMYETWHVRSPCGPDDEVSNMILSQFVALPS